MVHKASISRRRFLKATAAAVSAPLFLPASARGANDRITIAANFLNYEGPRQGVPSAPRRELPRTRPVARHDMRVNSKNSQAQKIPGTSDGLRLE